MSADRSDAPPVRPDGLQLDEHRQFQEKFWTVERFTWGAFLVFIVLALLGLTGDSGVFARRTVIMQGGTLDYPRVARWEGADEFIVQFDAGAPRRTLLLSPDFVANFQIEQIQPSPERSEAGADGNRLSFRFKAGDPASAKLQMRAQSPGLATYGIAVDEGAPVQFHILILP
ncbi:hypothetical protein [Devosia sp. A449]